MSWKTLWLAAQDATLSLAMARILPPRPAWLAACMAPVERLVSAVHSWLLPADVSLSSVTPSCVAASVLLAVLITDVRALPVTMGTALTVGVRPIPKPATAAPAMV